MERSFVREARLYADKAALKRRLPLYGVPLDLPCSFPECSVKSKAFRLFKFVPEIYGWFFNKICKLFCIRPINVVILGDNFLIWG